jgi:hypothetical protein
MAADRGDRGAHYSLAISKEMLESEAASYLHRALEAGHPDALWRIFLSNPEKIDRACHFLFPSQLSASFDQSAIADILADLAFDRASAQASSLIESEPLKAFLCYRIGLIANPHNFQLLRSILIACGSMSPIKSWSNAEELLTAIKSWNQLAAVELARMIKNRDEKFKFAELGFHRPKPINFTVDTN